ncbi:hypothetical protein GGQ73_003680 [Rhizobium skierniewicense]|uniref:Uncharacterized protein n=1 Tax=Rhizobium skierniewicense TaxID=984260 RepID=A0A7W6CAW1_9HYPH|nr:hypothetical protein [Rhizobium skierniewicense]
MPTNVSAIFGNITAFYRRSDSVMEAREVEIRFYVLKH